MTFKNHIIRAAFLALQASSILAMEASNDAETPYVYPPYMYAPACKDRMAAIPIIDDAEIRANLWCLKPENQFKTSQHNFPYRAFERNLGEHETINRRVTPEAQERTALYMAHHPAYTRYLYDHHYQPDFVKRMADYYEAKEKIDQMYDHDRQKSLILERLTYLSPDIQALPQLAELHLPHNSLISLPSFIGNLTSLKKLDLGTKCYKGEGLKILPSELGNLTQLESLNLSGQEDLIFLRADLLQNLNNLIELNLGGTGIIGLPNLPAHLEQLNISHTRIKHLPDSLIELKQLKCLDIAGLKRLDSHSKKLLQKLRKQGVKIIKK
jgi:hypothetical protein